MTSYHIAQPYATNNSQTNAALREINSLVNARRLEELEAAPEVELPIIAVQATLDNKKVRKNLGLFAIVLPTPWNIILLLLSIGVIVGFDVGLHAFGKAGGAYDIIWILVLYVILSFIVNHFLIGGLREGIKHF